MRRFKKRVLRCDCGYEVSAETDDEFVADVLRHALEAHGMELTTEDALLVAFRDQLDDFSRIASDPSSRRDGGDEAAGRPPSAQ